MIETIVVAWIGVCLIFTVGLCRSSARADDRIERMQLGS